MDFLSKRVLVVGAEGSGKSALLSRLTECKLSTKTNVLAESITECTVKAKFMGKSTLSHDHNDLTVGLHQLIKISIQFDFYMSI